MALLTCCAVLCMDSSCRNPRCTSWQEGGGRTKALQLLLLLHPGRRAGRQTWLRCDNSSDSVSLAFASLSVLSVGLLKTKIRSLISSPWSARAPIERQSTLFTCLSFASSSWQFLSQQQQIHTQITTMGNAASGPSKEAVVAAAKAKGNYMPPLGPPNPVSRQLALLLVDSPACAAVFNARPHVRIRV